MKSIRFIMIAVSFALVLPACSMFKPKYGCGTNGKNVGAEQLISGDPPKKVKKFKS